MTVEAVVPVKRTEPDQTVLEGLYRTHYQRLLRLAAVMLGERSAAEEAVQDAFYRLFRRGMDQQDDLTRGPRQSL